MPDAGASLGATATQPGATTTHSIIARHDAHTSLHPECWRLAATGQRLHREGSRQTRLALASLSHRVRRSFSPVVAGGKANQSAGRARGQNWIGRGFATRRASPGVGACVRAFPKGKGSSSRCCAIAVPCRRGDGRERRPPTAPGRARAHRMPLLTAGAVRCSVCSLANSRAPAAACPRARSPRPRLPCRRLLPLPPPAPAHPGLRNKNSKPRRQCALSLSLSSPAR